MWPRLVVLGCVTLVSVLLALAGSGLTAAQEDADAVRGKRMFSDAGCATCHGPSGRGAVGPTLVPMERVFPDFSNVVREGIGEMPGQAEDNVTDEQIALVYEYLVGLSQTPDGR
jgi:mono/diheme cytochrome c family protein